MSLYLIQGFFFKTGAHGCGFSRFMYSGTIYTGEHNNDYPVMGKMIDHFGESLLYDVIISPKKISFVKLYMHRSDFIHYNLTKKEGIWIGSYSGLLPAIGVTKCIVTEVLEDFFLPVNNVEGHKSGLNTSHH
jgi:hypothetical protein